MTTTAETVIIKPLGGIAGDMFVGAAAALWPERVERCLGDLAALDLPEHVSARFEPVRVNGFAAQKFRVEIDAENARVAPTGAYPAIVERIAQSGLDAAVRETALAILKILGEAEAAVHGAALETVHFHELADWDSIVDVVAAASFIARAPNTVWRTTSLPLGGGRASTAHGAIPVPAPAVLEILRGFAFHDDGVPGERVTPTGAAILRRLVDPADTAALDRGTLLRAGFGAGDKRFAEFANVVQLVALSAAGAEIANSAVAEETIVEIAFDIDDMTGEEIAAALDALRAVDGVLDATQTAQIGKKGRAMTLLRLLSRPGAADAVVERCFLETTTLGVRLTETRRRTLARRADVVDGARVKIAQRPDGRLTAKTESDDLISEDTVFARRRRAGATEADALDRTGRASLASETEDGGGDPET